jgi:hypothetical protein
MTYRCVACQEIRGTWQGVLGTCVHQVTNNPRIKVKREQDEGFKDFDLRARAVIWP